MKYFFPWKLKRVNTGNLFYQIVWTFEVLLFTSGTGFRLALSDRLVDKEKRSGRHRRMLPKTWLQARASSLFPLFSFAPRVSSHVDVWARNAWRTPKNLAWKATFRNPPKVCYLWNHMSLKKRDEPWHNQPLLH